MDPILEERIRCAEILIQRARMDTHPTHTLAMAAELVGGQEAYNAFYSRAAGYGCEAGVQFVRSCYPKQR